MRTPISVRWLAVIVAAAGFPPLALAALGDDVSSVPNDAVRMKAQVRAAAQSSAAYTVHELTLSSGTLVREYASAAGKIFAVTWTGPQKPNLEQAFGSYYAPFVAAANATPNYNHRHLMVRQPDLVVESNGRMRATFYGRAYVPSLVPANLNIASLP